MVQSIFDDEAGEKSSRDNELIAHPAAVILSLKKALEDLDALGKYDDAAIYLDQAIALAEETLRDTLVSKPGK